MPEEINCASCRFWDAADVADPQAFDDRPRGSCRRSPPQTRSDFHRIIADYLSVIARHLSQNGDEDAYSMHDSDAAAETYWPLTVADDWCGEFIARG
jgi:hypothetical protein